MSVTSGTVDPLTALLWDCSFPCQAIIHNRNTGQTTRSSPSGSCFFTAHRFGYLSYSIRMILEHFFDKNQPLAVSVGSSAARFWFSVEVPGATAMTEAEDPYPSTEAGRSAAAAAAAARKRSSLRLNDASASERSLQREGSAPSGGSSSHPIGASVGGGGGVARSIPVSCAKPFCVLIDELRSQLHFEAEYAMRGGGALRPPQSPSQAAAQGQQASGGGGGGVCTRVLLDLPLRLVLNIDDAPPSNILSLACVTYEREGNMLLRQYQKMNCVHLFGSVKPFLMLEPSTTQRLEEGCRRGDADSFVEARAHIFAKGAYEGGDPRERRGGGGAQQRQQHANTQQQQQPAEDEVPAGAAGSSAPLDGSASVAGGVGAASSSVGSAPIPPTAASSSSRLTTAVPCVFCFHVNGRGMAFRSVPAESPLARLGDVLRAFIVTFAGLTDAQILEDEPAPRTMGRVYLCGVEPSLCLPTDVMCATMAALDFAVHIVIDTRSVPLLTGVPASGPSPLASFASASGASPAGSPRLASDLSHSFAPTVSSSFAGDAFGSPASIVRARPAYESNANSTIA